MGSVLVDGLSSSEAEALEELLPECPIVALPAGLSRPGRSLGDASLLVIERGVVTVCSACADRGTVVLFDLGPGAVSSVPRRDDLVRALLDSCLTLVPESVYGRFLAVPALSRLVLQRLDATLRKAELAITSVAGTRSLEARLRQKLVQLAGEYGRVGANGIRIDVPLTHELLGEMTGARRESVTRTLAVLHNSGFVVRDGRSYRLPGCEPAALDEFLGRG
jgi:CRP-like cAMP-binding protein